MIAVIELWKCPVVFVDANPNPEKFDSIVADYRQAVEEIVSYLVACGHTKIGMIGCREVNVQGVESLDTRLHCFQDALTRKGLYLSLIHIWFRSGTCYCEGNCGIASRNDHGRK